MESTRLGTIKTSEIKFSDDNFTAYIFGRHFYITDMYKEDNEVIIELLRSYRTEQFKFIITVKLYVSDYGYTRYTRIVKRIEL